MEIGFLIKNITSIHTVKQRNCFIYGFVIANRKKISFCGCSPFKKIAIDRKHFFAKHIFTIVNAIDMFKSIYLL